MPYKYRYSAIHEFTLKMSNSNPIPGSLNIFKKIFFNVYLFISDRDRQSMSGGGAEREGDIESKQALGSELSAQSLTRRSNSWTVRS